MQTLFDPPHNSTPTSIAAASTIDTATLRRRVLDYIASRKRWGATDDEIQAALSMSGNTERPRRRELVIAGSIVDSGTTRPTSTGRAAVVWRVG